MTHCDGCGKELKKGDEAYGISGVRIEPDGPYADDDEWQKVLCKFCIAPVMEFIGKIADGLKS